MIRDMMAAVVRDLADIDEQTPFTVSEITALYQIVTFDQVRVLCRPAPPSREATISAELGALMANVRVLVAAKERHALVESAHKRRRKSPAESLSECSSE